MKQHIQESQASIEAVYGEGGTPLAHVCDARTMLDTTLKQRQLSKQLSESVTDALTAMTALTQEEKFVFQLCSQEVVRQVSVQCRQRGNVLQMLQKEYLQWMELVNALSVTVVAAVETAAVHHCHLMADNKFRLFLLLLLLLLLLLWYSCASA